MFLLTVQFICELQQNIRHFVILFVFSVTQNGIFDIAFEAGTCLNFLLCYQIFFRTSMYYLDI
jgi:hypothetical protein